MGNFAQHKNCAAARNSWPTLTLIRKVALSINWIRQVEKKNKTPIILGKINKTRVILVSTTQVWFKNEKWNKKDELLKI